MEKWVFTTSLQQKKDYKSGGFSLCHYSHSAKRCPETLNPKASQKSLYLVCISFFHHFPATSTRLVDHSEA